MSICLVGLFDYMLNDLLWKNDNDKNSPMTIQEIIGKLGGYYWMSILASFILIIIPTHKAKQFRLPNNLSGQAVFFEWVLDSTFL